MRFIRYRADNNQPEYGWVTGDREDPRLGIIQGSPFSEFQRLEARTGLNQVEILAPVRPGKIICIGRNFLSQSGDTDTKPPEVPLLFMKPPSTVIGHKGTIKLPPQSRQVEHESELAVVIRKKGRWIVPESVHEHILGYTIANDVTARDLQRRDGQWTRSKGFDSFCPLGPWIETEFDPADALITCYVNGEMRQMASTRDMSFNIRTLIAFVSSVMTLNPGDVILTGTPPGVGLLSPNDRVEITIEGIGTLINFVAKEPEVQFDPV